MEEASAIASRNAADIEESVAFPVVRGTAARRGRALTGISRKAVRCKASSSNLWSDVVVPAGIRATRTQESSRKELATSMFE